MEEDKGQTSSSCPLIPLRPAEQVLPYRGGRKKEPPPVFMSEESKLQWLKEREKKDQHNTSQYTVIQCLAWLNSIRSREEFTGTGTCAVI